jgi:hypothetical protein
VPEEEREGSARRRRRGGDAPVKCEVHLHHVVFRGRLLEINTPWVRSWHVSQYVCVAPCASRRVSVRLDRWFRSSVGQ